jgi:mRNA interferase RelE/StbE
LLKILIDKRNRKFLEKLPCKHFLQIDSKILELGNNPFTNDSSKLKGCEGYYRVDSGEYRIIYHLDNILHIDLIGKRNDSDIYRKFSHLIK